MILDGTRWDCSLSQRSKFHGTSMFPYEIPSEIIGYVTGHMNSGLKQWERAWSMLRKILDTRNCEMRESLKRAVLGCLGAHRCSMELLVLETTHWRPPIIIRAQTVSFVVKRDEERRPTKKKQAIERQIVHLSFAIMSGSLKVVPIRPWSMLRKEIVSYTVEISSIFKEKTENPKIYAPGSRPETSVRFYSSSKRICTKNRWTDCYVGSLSHRALWLSNCENW